MIELDTVVGIAAFSLMLPVLVVQLLYYQNGMSESTIAYAHLFVADSKLQVSAASFASSNLTLSQARAALHVLFGNAYELDANASSVDAGSRLAERILVIEGMPYYVKVYQNESPVNP